MKILIFTLFPGADNNSVHRANSVDVSRGGSDRGQAAVGVSVRSWVHLLRPAGLPAVCQVGILSAVYG